MCVVHGVVVDILSHTQNLVLIVLLWMMSTHVTFSPSSYKERRAYLTHLHGAWQNATGVPKIDVKAVQLPKLVYGGKAKVYLVLFLQ